MIEFVDNLPDPPPGQQRRSLWRQIVGMLDERPGEWAKVFTSSSRDAARTRAYQLRRQFPDHEWEYRGVDVYGRAVPVRIRRGT